jgi:hypothetical protein
MGKFMGEFIGRAFAVMAFLILPLLLIIVLVQVIVSPTPEAPCDLPEPPAQVVPEVYLSCDLDNGVEK